jgi:CheY-like chemotaxis protein
MSTQSQYWSKILIVEDEGITAQALKEALSDMGCEVLGIVTTGWEAVEKARDLKPDLVLMDIKLKGGMDGVSATQRIQTQLNIPVVYLTAYSDNDTLKRVLHSGAYGYVVKPFDQDELQSVISQAIRQHLLRRT